MTMMASWARASSALRSRCALLYFEQNIGCNNRVEHWYLGEGKMQQEDLALVDESVQKSRSLTIRLAWSIDMAPLGLQDCHIDIKEEDVSDLMVEEGFCHEAEAIMRVETFKRCLLHVSPAHPCRFDECDITCAL